MFVLTDISNEPDDEESLVRLLVYANEFEIEGIVATTSTWLKRKPHEEKIRQIIRFYREDYERLCLHAPGFPAPDQLLEICSTGQSGYGLKAVGEGKSSKGSRLLMQAAQLNDERPLWVVIWGGANTLAQALYDMQRECPEVEFQKIVENLRVYAISDQDDSGVWIRREFPDLFYIVSPSSQDWKDYAKSTWTGGSGDRYYGNGPEYKFCYVDNPWLEANIIQNHGSLGANYPLPAFIMEGDTPSFLGLIDRGLGWVERPDYGGWGGRYVFEKPEDEPRPIWTNNNSTSRDTIVMEDGTLHCSDQATIWRWREHFQNDFAARMDWCVVREYADANHNPIPLLNGDSSTCVVRLNAKPGVRVPLSAKGTRDPDGDTIHLRWWIYEEAGTIQGASLSNTEGSYTEVLLPNNVKKGNLHVILEVMDEGIPSLFAYRRAVIEVNRELTNQELQKFASDALSDEELLAIENDPNQMGDKEDEDSRFFVPTTISTEWQTFLKNPPFPIFPIHEDLSELDAEGWHQRWVANEEVFSQYASSLKSSYRCSIEEKEIGGIPVIDIYPEDWKNDGRVLVYCHGGGYTMGSAASTLYNSLLVSDYTGFRVVSIDYTVAPQAKWQEITDQVIAVLNGLQQEGYTPENIGIYGDSAGGGLAAGAVLKMRDRGLSMPGAVVLWSPWSDITASGETLTTLRDGDPLLSMKTLKASADAYADTQDQKHPYVSPVYGDYSKGFPPTLIQGGTREIFLSHMVRHYQAIESVGQDATLDLYEGMIHVFQPMVPQSPESKLALKKMKVFLEQSLGSLRKNG